MKRGMSTEGALITIVLIAVVLVVSLVIWKVLFSVTKSQYSEKECQASLQLTKSVDALQPACVTKISNPIPIKCSRDYVTIKNDAVYKNGLDIKGEYEFNCPDKQATCLAKNAVAEEMRGCWRTFFEGQQVVLQQAEENALNVLSSKDYSRICYVCSEITLQTAQDQTGFLDYLKQTKMPYSDGKSYYEYLAQGKSYCDKDLVTSETPTCFEGVAAGKSPTMMSKILEKDRPDIRPTLTSIKTGKSYAVTFIRRGAGSCETGENKWYKNAHLTNTVELVPMDDIANVCDTVFV